MEHAQPSAEPVIEVEPPPQRSWLARRIASQNPFYLLSAALVIHSTGLSLQPGAGSLPTPMLVGLIAGYLVLLAGVCLFIVRRWNVWEDARSIPLILVLLLLELSLCFDSVLQQSRWRGVLGLLGCGLAAVVVSETVIRGLRLRLPAVYRAPFYLQLLLCLLPGGVYAGLAGTHSPSFVRWALFAYAGLVGASLLTLIPAARQSARSVASQHCPWIWPIHPWSLFIVVWLCLGFRLVLLTLSFDPAVELDRIAANENLLGVFSPFWLAPMVLGLGWLMVEAGQFHKNTWLRACGLAMPAAAFLMAVASVPSNAAARQFVGDWLATVGSPLWCSLLAALAFYGAAMLRGVPGARTLLMYSVLPLCVVQPQTVSLEKFDTQAIWPLVLLAAVRIFQGLLNRRSWPIFEGLCWLIGAGLARGAFDGWPLPAQSLVFDAVLAALLIARFTIWDDTSELLEGAALLGIGMRAVAATCTCLLSPVPMLPELAELLALLLTTGIIALSVGEPEWQNLGKFVAALAYFTTFWEGWKMLAAWTTWEGLNQFVLGVLLLHIGVAWSAWKSRRVQAGAIE